MNRAAQFSFGQPRAGDGQPDRCINVTSNVFHSADVVFTADDLNSGYFEQDNDIQ